MLFLLRTDLKCNNRLEYLAFSLRIMHENYLGKATTYTFTKDIFTRYDIEAKLIFHFVT